MNEIKSCKDVVGFDDIPRCMFCKLVWEIPEDISPIQLKEVWMEIYHHRKECSEKMKLDNVEHMLTESGMDVDELLEFCEKCESFPCGANPKKCSGPT